MSGFGMSGFGMSGIGMSGIGMSGCGMSGHGEDRAAEFDRGGSAAADRALHGVGPSGRGPRAGQDQTRQVGGRRRTEPGGTGRLAERRAPLTGDEELGDLRL